MTTSDKTRYWQSIIADSRASSLSQKAFCAKREINYANFRYWHKKLSPAKTMEHTAEFVPVTIQPVSAVVVHHQGFRLEVRVDALPQVLSILQDHAAP